MDVWEGWRRRRPVECDDVLDERTSSSSSCLASAPTKTSDASRGSVLKKLTSSASAGSCFFCAVVRGACERGARGVFDEGVTGASSVAVSGIFPSTHSSLAASFPLSCLRSPSTIFTTAGNWLAAVSSSRAFFSISSPTTKAMYD